jgi:Tfp pilus assembly protein PilO
MKAWDKLKAFYTLFSRFSPRERNVLYVTAFFVSLTLLDRLIISPIASKMQSLDEEIQQKESDIRKNLRIFAQKDRILSETAKYAVYLNSLKYDEESMNSILKEIEAIANKSSVYIVDMKPAAIKELGATKKYMVNLECETQMEQLTDFMYNIENSSKLFRIERYQITPKSKESSIARCSMSISKLAMP